MTFRTASFKGATFHVEETSGQFGRRTVLHEYPFRDIPYGEDLGRAARRFDVSAFFLNQSEWQKFIDACESDGAGTLIHPHYGRAFVQLENPADVRFPKVSGGKWSVRVTFIEAGENTEPDAAEDAGSLLDALIDDALNALGLEFASQWLGEIAGYWSLAETRLNMAYDFIERFLSPLAAANSQLQRLMMGSFLARPLALFYRISGLVRSIGQTSVPFVRKRDFGYTIAKMPAFQPSKPTPQNTALLRELRRAIEPTTWTVTQLGNDVQPMPPSLADAVRHISVLEQVRLLATDDYVSRDDLLAARSRALAALDAEIYRSRTPASYRSLEAVRAQAVRTIDARTPTLREIAVLQTKTTLPALVLAYQVNGTIDAYADIVARNKVRNPCFVPAGQVEVMRDGQ